MWLKRCVGSITCGFRKSSRKNYLGFGKEQESAKRFLTSHSEMWAERLSPWLTDLAALVGLGEHFKYQFPDIAFWQKHSSHPCSPFAFPLHHPKTLHLFQVWFFFPSYHWLRRGGCLPQVLRAVGTKLWKVTVLVLFSSIFLENKHNPQFFFFFGGGNPKIHATFHRNRETENMDRLV